MTALNRVLRFFILPTRITLLSMGKWLLRATSISGKFGALLLLLGLFAAPASIWAQNCDFGCPEEVEVRFQTGEMNELQELLIKHNPEFARLTFAEKTQSPRFEEGFEPWYSPGKKFYLYKRHPLDSSGYLFLDGHCSWLVHDLNSMQDVSQSTLDGITSGTYPTIHKETFFMVGGYGNFRFHRNWYRYFPTQKGIGISRYTKATKQEILTGESPPNVMVGAWRNDSLKSYFYLCNTHALDEPNWPPNHHLHQLYSDDIKEATNQLQVWQNPDSTSIDDVFEHVWDINPAVLQTVPAAVVEAENWVIFVDGQSKNTFLLHKHKLDWVQLQADHNLPAGSHKGVNGWMIQGDTLLVVGNGEIEHVIDLNEHAKRFASTHADVLRLNKQFRADPKTPEFKFVNQNKTPWEWIAIGLLALVGVIVWSRQQLTPMKGELKNMTKQIQVVEYFSRSIFRSTNAEDILWDITAKTISQLQFTQCEVFLLADDDKTWVQKTKQVGSEVPNRQAHVPAELALNDGLVGAVGLSGNVELIEDVTKDGRFDVGAFQCKSLMAVPIICDARVIGVIVNGHRKAGFFQPEHKRIIENVANICGQKLGRTLSERKISEFAQVYEQNPGPVLRISNTGQVLLTNDSAKAHFGVHANVGESLKFLDIIEHAQDALKRQTPVATSLHHLSRIYQVNLLPYPELGYVNMYASDVTELEQARSRAEKAERAKTDFLSVMSHEIRTPLNAIMGLNELMLKAEPSEDQVKQLKYMQYSGKQLLSLVNDILSLESLEDQKSAMKPSTFNMSELMRKLAETFASNAKEHGNALEVICPPEGDAWVLGDRHWISQMVNNLLDNAVKFTHRGTITLSARPSAQPERWVIDVEDTGIGIPVDHLARITDPFEQVLVNPKNTAVNQGTGLGLAIVKKLAHLHGGELQVQSTEGVGSKFTLNLSITPSEPQLASQTPPSSSAHLQDPEALNVLIVDDNSMNLMVAKKQIELLGHKVISAINGQEAIDQWKQHQPDFILMDLQMPVMDGMEATRHIRRLIQKSGGSHVPIVALTADAEESTREEALTAGLDMVLVKPSDTETLRQAIAATTSHGKG